MRQIICHECGKRYRFEEDDFCPRCGAFTPPAKEWDVDAKGNVVRVDGINEKNHAGSFVHKEVHREKAVRMIKGLDRDHRAPAKKVTTRSAKKKPVKLTPSLGGAAERAEKGKGSNTLSIISTALALLAVLLKILLG